MTLRNGFNNLLSGLLRQIIVLILGLILPRLIMVSYGSEINGFMSSVMEVVSYLALLEVGVGTATLQALYRPVATNIHSDINSIMAATNNYYKKTGVIYGLLVIVFSILYPLIVDTGLVFIEVVVFILLSGLPGVLNYFFQGKYKILLQAEGKNYILTNLSTIVTICTSVSKILLISLGYNVVTVQASYFLFNFLQMIYLLYYIKKNYRWLNFNVEKNYRAISQKNSVMLHEISYMIFTHTDIILLTFFTNLTTVSVYTVYQMIFGAIESLINNFSTSMQYIFGQTYSKSLINYKKIYDAFELIFLNISFSFFSVTYLFITPFLKIYTLGITDANYLIPYLPVLFVSVRLLTSIRTITNQAITVSGHFETTQRIAILEAIINLILSLILINQYGIYGVLIGTIVALSVRVIYTIIYVNRNIINRSPFTTLRRVAISIVNLIVVKEMSGAIDMYYKDYFSMLIMAMLFLIAIMLFNSIVFLLTDYKTIKYTVELMKNRYRKVIDN